VIVIIDKSSKSSDNSGQQKSLALRLEFHILTQSTFYGRSHLLNLKERNAIAEKAIGHNRKQIAIPR
jgi:hypothetical protein